jgi:tetratricopeptide (TPR) repeat protein
MSRIAINWIAPLILLATGCTNLPGNLSTGPEKVAQLLEQQRYGQAKAVLSQVPETDPKYAELQALRKSVDKQAAAYQRNTLEEGKKLERSGDWYEAQQHYQRALNNLHESEKIKAAQDGLQLKIDARVAALEIDLLMVKGEWLKQGLIIRTKISRLLPPNRIQSWRHGSVQKEAKQVAAELGDLGNRAVDQGDFSRAEQMYTLALALHNDPAIEEARKALRDKNRRAIVRNVQAEHKALSISLQKALSQDQLGKAAAIAARLEKQGTPTKEEQKLIQQLNRDIRTQVNKELELGTLHYSRSEYKEAVSAWNKVLTLEPDNTEAAIRIERANRILEKLRQLSQEKAG